LATGPSRGSPAKKIRNYDKLTFIPLLGKEVVMARVTVEDCLEREENRFALVVLAAARTRQIMKGSQVRVRARNKASVLSLREIAAGKVHFNRPSTKVVEEWIEQAVKRDP
jgi:DNA-directed RNA polymerase subunit omega